ncbi:hypothetical protein CN271_03845 [Bacillus cereus]|nr:hypothetical protein CON59_19640 [Bacillus cereus]PET39220.1 hypothetical protein CN523_25310 [Bacillus cereus]PEV71993.1 hypothetical protein CN429_29905 [Bacillus cereus]PFA55792.1 hypothetical protein CN389_14710 [Bacillus cereus]PFD79677.1 hypothetical protein CN271_03845 [Bacillus cereus]
MFFMAVQFLNKIVNLNKKRAPREERQGFASLSYVVLTRDFNMNIVLNILVNVCNLFREVILDKNAI